jgi:hypothetical protein
MECYFDYKLHFELSLMENDKVDYICPFNCVCVYIFFIYFLLLVFMYVVGIYFYFVHGLSSQ